jgi:exodeoxyribonuclease V alpha subunit
MQSQDASPALTLDPSQREALALILTEPFGIVTGGPGTGKTTILKEALLALGGQSVALAAPTGKAAKRMEEVTGASAQTIHRLLQWSPLTQAFRFCEDEPLGFDVVIVDEASMIDVLLFDSLLSAIHPSRTRLILMGDANQLPSVGPGAILGDLVRCGQVPCARLTQVHRSAADSWICSMAPRVLSGAELDMTKRTDFEFVSCESNMDVASACADLYETTRAQFFIDRFFI